MHKLEDEPGLVAAVQEGRAVLFLGAGASRGATGPAAAELPDASLLAREIAQNFLGKEYESYDLNTVCDLVAADRGIPVVQEYIHSRLYPFQPAEFHKIIPTFAWSGLFTTNYDLLIERAYTTCLHALQSLIVLSKDDETPVDTAVPNTLLYIKLHGCISRYQETEPPLIANTEQLIRYRTGRVGLFATFLEWAKVKTIIFAGYSFMDSNLRVLVDEIVKDGDKRPRHYIVNPGLRHYEQRYWSERKFHALDFTFGDFLIELDRVIPTSRRALGIVAEAMRQTSFTKFIGVAGRQESPGLRAYMAAECVHVSSELQPNVDTPQRFFRGFDTAWFPYDIQLDVRRRVVDSVLREQVLGMEARARTRFVLIKAHAGAGKTIALRRIAWEAGRRFSKLVFYVDKSSMLDLEKISEIISLTKEKVFLFIDDVADHREALYELLQHARWRRWPLVVIGAERFNEWNIFCDTLEDYLDQEYEIGYLSTNEINELLDKLETFDCLGYLASLPRDVQRAHLSERYGRQLLVALHEATNGASFEDILKNEYDTIIQEEARILYLDICSLHRFGSPVRAGLISRVHDITFDDFRDRFLAPLEKVVELKRDVRSGDYVYQARHTLIAQIVFERILTSQEERFENVMRIVSKLNPSYSYDRDVIQQITRAENMISWFPDRAKADAIYDRAEEQLGGTAPLLHQRGIHEMQRAEDRAVLERAGAFLERAAEVAPHNRVIRHSMAELALKRARLSDDELERVAWRKLAESTAGDLTLGSRNSYPHHTLLKAAIDGVRDALERVEHRADELSHRAFEEAIKKAEDLLRRSLEKFPNDEHLLAEEATLSRILQDANRALVALEKAFAANPKGELIARRLARVYRCKNMMPNAVKTLRRAIEYNPANIDLNYELALALMDEEPDASINKSDAILYHLERSFVSGDKRYQARFWYARQLCLTNNYDKAKAVFETLRALPRPLSVKNEVKGVVKTTMDPTRCSTGRFMH